MSVTHTPGPWEALGPYVRSPRPLGALVAVCASPVDSAAVTSAEQQTANRNLIAAAPDLYAALEEALSEAIERDEDLGYNCWPQVIAALNKAQGK